MPDELAARLGAVREQVSWAAARAGRDAGGVGIIAVTKTLPAAAVRAALALGLADIGENYVQEARAKRAAVGGAGTWHLIGGLQRNKVRAAVATFDQVQTVDSAALAEALAAEAARAGRRLPVSIQVNATADPRKRGLPPEATAALAETILGLRELELRGLMTIGPAGPAEASRPCFRLLRELRDDVAIRLGVELCHLCMGMSDDFTVAVEEGATLLRLGRALFGDRGPGSWRPGSSAGGRGFMKKIGFVGAGNMAGALLKGMLHAGQLKPDDVWASDPVDAQLRRLKRLHRIETTRDNRALVRQSQTIVLAVKPQAMAGLLDEIRPEVTPRKLFVSIAAGFPLRRLEAGLGGQARVVRVMPNTPVLVGKGISVAVAGSKATPADLKQTLKLFKAVGEAVSITGEDLLDAVTALSGSGPAFVYLFAEALIEGGVRGGLPQSLAAQLAHATVGGAAAMLAESGLSSRELRDMVTSPGGTTLAGLATLETHHVRDALIAAVEAATRRARELAAA